MNGIASAVKRHPLISFFVIAYALSWSWWLPIAFAGDVVRPGAGWPTQFPGLLGPLIAAFVVTALCQGSAGVQDLLARMGPKQAGTRWWMIAVGSPLLFFAAGLAAVALSGGRPDLHGLDALSGLPIGLDVTGVWVLLVLINGYGEETGWRGFALPHLQRRYSPLVATVILTVFWALWHAPLFVILQSFQEFSPLTLPGFFFGMLCGAVVLTWIYNGSGGSILMVALWHGTYNLASATEASQGTIAAVVTTFVMVWAVLLVVLERRAGRRRRFAVDRGAPTVRRTAAPPHRSTPYPG